MNKKYRKYAGMVVDFGVRRFTLVRIDARLTHPFICKDDGTDLEYAYRFGYDVDSGLELLKTYEVK